MIIALSGIDGSGKTTLGRLLSRRHCWRYRKQRIGRRTSQVENVLKDQISEMCLAIGRVSGRMLAESYFADTIEYRDRYVSMPSPGATYLFDRWTLCLSAYARMMKCYDLSLRALVISPVPDFTIYLDLNPLVALQRIRAKRRPDWDETPEVLKAYRASYLELLGTTMSPTEVIDASRPLEYVVKNVETRIMERMRKWRRPNYRVHS